MEIEGPNGSKAHLDPDSSTLFGRGNGFFPKDLTVSRHHISLTQTGPNLSFEVVGKNPVWVCSEGGKVDVFKRFQRAKIGIGDKFCVSAKDPVWFTVKMVEERESVGGEIGGRVCDELSQSLESDGDFELCSFDVSNIDPVQEFGFLVIGHEFDQYKQMIRDIKKWDWFLEDPRRDSDDEEDTGKKGKKGARRKRKKTKGDDDMDEEWTDESENDEAIVTKRNKAERANYRTRSKDHGKPRKDKLDKKFFAETSMEEEEKYEDLDEDEDDDETLGGFIVDDDRMEEENGEDELDEEEEEELVEDEDELED